GELEYSRGEVLLSRGGGVETQRGARRHVVDDLHHRAAFVAEWGQGLSAVIPLRENSDIGGQFAACDVILRGGEWKAGLQRLPSAIETVRENTDAHASAVHAEVLPGQVGVHGHVSLR